MGKVSISEKDWEGPRRASVRSSEKMIWGKEMEEASISEGVLYLVKGGL